jgi:hypothetical protein
LAYNGISEQVDLVAIIKWLKHLLINYTINHRKKEIPGGAGSLAAFILSFLFVILIDISAFMQASDNQLKKIVNPGLTACCGLLVLVGAISRAADRLQGVLLGAALLLLALNDFIFERSASKPDLFPLIRLGQMRPGNCRRGET